MTLADLRAHLDLVDADLIRIIAERQRIVADIGALKRSQGRALRDFKREREVIENVRGAAERAGLDAALGESVMRALIDASLTKQEQQGLSAHAQGDGQRALVIGGNGRMGRWFAAFLEQQGYSVDIDDPSGTPDGYRAWRGAPAADHDLIVVAAPLKSSNAVLERLAGERPSGVVLEIGSIKTPLQAGVRALRDAGVDVGSVHPLFGPSANLLAGKHVIVCNLGSARATALAHSLFAPTLAQLSEIELDEHDRLMAWILALSHFSNLAFAGALASSGLSIALLERCASSTFERQCRIAADVVAESPELYFEIQSANPHNAAARDRGDTTSFINSMGASAAWFAAAR
jgi:chorismate mutase / prephenate dehydrogenase